MRATRLILLLALAATPALAQAPGTPDAPTPVRVEREKPMKEKHATLRFLRENRDFIRARYDRLREKPLDVRADAGTIDPRYLRYAELLAALGRDRDSLALTEEARARRDLFASVSQLSELEQQLDQMELALAEQRGRLATLEQDFSSDPRTELIVVVSGASEGGPVNEIHLELEDGGVLTLPITEAQRASLDQGGMVELFHGFIEPRVQMVRLGLLGSTWTGESSGWLQIDPARDRLNLLRLDFSTLDSSGAAGLRAGTWVHASTTLSIDG